METDFRWIRIEASIKKRKVSQMQGGYVPQKREIKKGLANFVAEIKPMRRGSVYKKWFTE